MADFLNNAWHFTTADAGGTIHYKANLYIHHIYWFNPTTIAHTFSLQDMNTISIQEGRCEVANQSQTFLIEGWYQGLKLPVLSSGDLFVYIK